MKHDSETETVEVEIKFLELRSEEEPDLLVRATLATCPRCRMSGCAVDQSSCSVAAAIENLRNFCPGDGEPRVYVPAPGAEPPDDRMPF